MSLKTKNVFLTGGAQGLGKGYTEALLKLGARVVIADINETVGKETEKELNEKYGAGKVFFVKLDVTNEAQYKEALAKAVAHLGFVDLFVSNAGILDEKNPDLTVAINFSGVIKGVLLFEEHMRKDKGGKGGRIIVCASGAATVFDRRVSFGHPVYTATKQGVRAFVMCLSGAPDIKEQGIEYGVHCPGPADTKLCENLQSTVRYADLWQVGVDQIMSTVDEIVPGFIALATLEDMNAAIVEAYRGVYTFVRLDRTEVGQKWPTENGESTTRLETLEKKMAKKIDY